MATLPCPTCKRPVDWSPENKWRPFCSERCKLIDLGAWAAEKHVIPAESIEDESETALSRDDEPKPQS